MPDNRDLQPTRQASDPLDRLIDQALTTYSDVEPDPALRARITTRLSYTPPRSMRLWSYAALAACAATLCFFLYPGAKRAAHPDETSVATSSAPHAAASRQPQADEVTSRVRHPGVVTSQAVPHPGAVSSRVPRAGVITSRVPHPNEVRVGMLPLSASSRRRALHNEASLGSRPHHSSTTDAATLTAEERALLELTTERPEEAQQLLAVRATDQEPLAATPLTFAPIHIAPLATPEPLHAD